MKINNSQGITLVEILAAVVIASILIITILVTFSNGNKLSNRQTEDNLQLVDTTYALKVITKDIRQHDASQIHLKNLTADTEKTCYKTLEIDQVDYSLTDANLVKGEEVLSKKIQEFKVCTKFNSVDSNMLEIMIESTNGKKEDTVIIIR